MIDRHPLASYLEDLESFRQHLPFPVYVESLQEYTAYETFGADSDLGNHLTIELARRYRSFSVPSNQFWQLATRVAENYGLERDWCPPVRDEVNTANHNLVGYYTGADELLLELSRILKDAGAKTIKKPNEKLQEEASEIAAKARELRDLIDDFKKTSGCDESWTLYEMFDGDFWDLELDFEFSPDRSLQLLEGLAQAFDMAESPVTKRQKTKRHRVFATQLSGWFRSYDEGKPHIEICTELTTNILRAECGEIDLLAEPLK